jgi:hypothetical protein
MTDQPTLPDQTDPPADTPKVKPTKTVIKSAAKAVRGIHVVFDKDGVPVTAYSGEMDSLRHAIEIGGKARHVGFGEDFAKS